MQYLRWTRLSPSSTTPPVKNGEVVREDDTRFSPQVRERLIASGTLAPIQTPPLFELPDWEERAGILAELGIVTISDLAAANERSVAKGTGKSIKLIRQWIGEAEKWLNPESQTVNDSD